MLYVQYVVCVVFVILSSKYKRLYVVCEMCVCVFHPLFTFFVWWKEGSGIRPRQYRTAQCLVFPQSCRLNCTLSSHSRSGTE